jgi:hypothetical protein
VALATYTDLQASIAGWLMDRTDLTARIPDFIALAEADMNRTLRTAAQETVTTLSTVAGTETVALPAGYLEGRSLTILTNPRRRLTFQSIGDLLDNFASGSGVPQAYAISGATIYLGPTPDAVYSIRLVYYAQVPALAAGNPSNWVLASHPDLYLYGALMHAAPYLYEDQRVATWAGAYQAVLDRLSAADEAARWSGGPLTMRSGRG